MKQLMDLLDQIAGAAGQDVSGAAGQDVPVAASSPRTRGVAATARAAIDAMRRGVIAYTAPTD
jgi:hypothetical protein